MKKRFLILPIFLGLLASCGTSPEQPDDPTVKHVEKVTLSEKEKIIEVGESFSLTATVTPDDADDKSVIWTTSDESVATVNNGTVTGVSDGEVTITVKTVDQEKKATCSVTVLKEGERVYVDSIELSKTDITLVKGEKTTVSATISPSNATEKGVVWSSDDESVATVKNGTITAVNAGETTIIVNSKDGNATAEINITVIETVVPDVDTETFFFEPIEDSQFEKKSNVDITTTPFTRSVFTFTFAQNTAANKPVYTYTNGSGTHKAGGSFRLYPMSSMTISSSKNIDKVEFTYYEYKDEPTIPLTTDVGTFSSHTWTGKATSVTFTAGSAEKGARAIQTITITYENKSGHDPIDLEVKTVKEVKEYIAANPVSVNSHQCGVDENTEVTIQGLAMARISLVKTAKDFGLNVSEPSKIIIGDATDAIAVATKTGDNTLYDKVDNHSMKSTSYYKVTGYISIYLGQPEIVCTDFEYLPSVTSGVDISKITKGEITIPEFYNKAADVNYNCAGHGYGDVFTLKGLTCYNYESGGQGKDYYNFTDGTNNIRVNAFNIGKASVGYVYDLTGIISLKDLSPIIVAFEIKTSTAAKVDLTSFYTSATTQSISTLLTVHGSQDDTDTRYPNVVKSFQNLYKVEGYLCVVEENGKLYVGIADSYKGETFIVGKDNAKANYGVALIENDNFWNTTEEKLARYNPYYEDYLCEDEKVTIYYVNRQLNYKQKKPMWQILVIPQSIPTI